LIRHWFDHNSHKAVNSFCIAAKRYRAELKRFHWRSFVSALPYGEGELAHPGRRAKMAWKTPKIVEVPVGMEINMYACAARK
jgi:coenzyme PQQ precursor peptide PqqA